MKAKIDRKRGNGSAAVVYVGFVDKAASYGGVGNPVGNMVFVIHRVFHAGMRAYPQIHILLEMIGMENSAVTVDAARMLI